MGGRITADDEGAKVVLVAALMLSYTCICLMIRLQTRWPWTRRFRSEDVLLLAAAVSAAAHTAVLCVAVSRGYGQRTVAPSALQGIQDALAVGFVLFYLAKGLSIASYGKFLEAVAAENDGHRLISSACQLLAGTCCAAAVVTASVCAAWRTSIAKSAQITFAAVQTATLTIMFLNLARVISMTRMSFLRKTLTIIWFSLSVWITAIVVMRLLYTPRYLFAPGFTLSTVNFFVVMIIELHFHVFTAAYPNFLVFVDRTTTGFIAANIRRPSLGTLPASSEYSSEESARKSASVVRAAVIPQQQYQDMERMHRDGIAFAKQPLMTAESGYPDSSRGNG